MRASSIPLKFVEMVVLTQFFTEKKTKQNRNRGERNMIGARYSIFSLLVLGLELIEGINGTLKMKRKKVEIFCLRILTRKKGKQLNRQHPATNKIETTSLRM